MNNFQKQVSQNLVILRDENKHLGEKKDIISKKIPEELKNLTSQLSSYPQESIDLKSQIERELKALKLKIARADIDEVIYSLISLSA